MAKKTHAATKSAKIEESDDELQNLQRQLKWMEKHSLTVGIHATEGNAKYPSGISLLEVAMIHELGLGVPQRSFIAGWYDENEKKLEKDLVQMGVAIAKGEVDDAETGLGQLGAKWVGEIQKRIRSGIAPPLAPATIAAKGSSVALIDTSQLWKAIMHKVANIK